MKDLILIGGGGHCHSCIDVIELEAKFNIVGIVDTKEKVGTKVLGYDVIGTDDDLEELSKKCDSFLITLGQIKSPSLRIKIYSKLKSISANLATIVSPRSHVSKHASIGEGTIIMHDVVVNANSKIGNNCIINTKCLIEHDCNIEDHCHISTASVVNGDCSIGEGSFIGSNTVLKNGRIIEKESVIPFGIKQ